MGGGKGNWFKSYMCSRFPSPECVVGNTVTGRGVTSIQMKTLKRRQGREERGGKENVNWIVEKETGEEAVELPEERGGWAEARRK